jgi:hypothetical protein
MQRAQENLVLGVFRPPEVVPLHMGFLQGELADTAHAVKAARSTTMFALIPGVCYWPVR